MVPCKQHQKWLLDQDEKELDDVVDKVRRGYNRKRPGGLEEAGDAEGLEAARMRLAREQEEYDFSGLKGLFRNGPQLPAYDDDEGGDRGRGDRQLVAVKQSLLSLATETVGAIKQLKQQMLSLKKAGTDGQHSSIEQEPEKDTVSPAGSLDPWGQGQQVEAQSELGEDKVVPPEARGEAAPAAQQVAQAARISGTDRSSSSAAGPGLRDNAQSLPPRAFTS